MAGELLKSMVLADSLPSHRPVIGGMAAVSNLGVHPEQHWQTESPAVDHVQAVGSPRPLAGALLRMSPVQARDVHVRLPVLVWGDEGPIR